MRNDLKVSEGGKSIEVVTAIGPYNAEPVGKFRMIHIAHVASCSFRLLEMAVGM